MNNELRNDDQANAPKVPSSRRSFLTRAAGVSALAVPTLTLITSRKARASTGKILTGLNAELISEIQSDEDQHVPIIQNLLDDPDNPLPVPIRKPPNLNMAPPDDNRTFRPSWRRRPRSRTPARGFTTGRCSISQQTQEYFPTAAGLAAVEARHAAWLNSLLGQALVEDFAPVEAPIAQSIVLTRVAEFVTDPRSTFPSFDTTVATDANGFFVLDFVLFLEYIESAFYDLNVPLFT